MIKTPEIKTKLKITNNILMPFWISLTLLHRKIGYVLPEIIFDVDMVLGVICSVLNLIIIKWNKIEGSKLEKLQKIESITANIALVIIILALLLWIFW